MIRPFEIGRSYSSDSRILKESIGDCRVRNDINLFSELRLSCA